MYVYICLHLDKIVTMWQKKKPVSVQGFPPEIYAILIFYLKVVSSLLKTM